MNKKIIAVMGGTGQIGHVIVEDLIKRGHMIRSLGRNAKKQSALLTKGAEVYLYDFDDVQGLTETFRDCYAVFCMIPPAENEEDYRAYQDKVGEAICKALENTHISRVVNLSSLGAELTESTGPILGLRRQEKRLDSLTFIKDLIHLRAGYFMENLTGAVPSIFGKGEISFPMDGSRPIPMVATRDIGWKAADFLERTDEMGRIYFDFMGPHALTFNEATTILGNTLDRPDLRYVQCSEEEMRAFLLNNNMGTKSVEGLLEMFRVFNEGRIHPTQEMTREHHGMTSFEEFAHMFAHKMLAFSKH